MGEIAQPSAEDVAAMLDERATYFRRRACPDEAITGDPILGTIADLLDLVARHERTIAAQALLLKRLGPCEGSGEPGDHAWDQAGWGNVCKNCGVSK